MIDIRSQFKSLDVGRRDLLDPYGLPNPTASRVEDKAWIESLFAMRVRTTITRVVYFDYDFVRAGFQGIRNVNCEGLIASKMSGEASTVHKDCRRIVNCAEV